MKSFFCCLLFITSGLMAQESIEVRLSTEMPLVPIYLSRVVSINGAFDNGYLDKVRQVLDFDMRHMAKTFLVHVDPLVEDFLAQEKTLDSAFWKKQTLAYLFSIRVQQKKLEITAFSEKKLLPDLFETTLTGNLSEDRMKIHQLSAKISKQIFGVEGMFTHRLLYTVRKDSIAKEGKKESSEIFVMDYDGANSKQITGRDAGYAVHPLFLPGMLGDPDRGFLFVSYKLGVPKIYRSSLRTPGKMDRMITLRGNQLIPAYSKERGAIAFICDAAGRPDLFIQEWDMKFGERNKPVQLFSLPRATQASPSFSPDGEKLTFVSDKDGTPRIYLMKIPEDLSGQKRPFVYLLTKKNRENVTPSWSADGTKLAYSAKTEGIRQIWIYDFITDEEWQLTKGPENKENPTWAPDGVHIVYNTEDNESSEIFLMNIHQKKPERINLGQGKKRFPSWETGSN